MLPHREWPSELSLMLSQCHGLWDEDDITDSGTDKEESDDELSLSRGRRASSDSLKSINLAASAESVHVSFPEQPTAIRRKRSGSSSQISPRSSFSSNRSKRGICHMISLGWKNFWVFWLFRCQWVWVLGRGVYGVLSRRQMWWCEKKVLWHHRLKFSS